MKPSFAHKKDIKKSVKSTYAQSYPHFPQKNMKTRPKNTVKNRKYVLCKMLKKNYLSKEIDKLNVEKCGEIKKN